MIAKSQTDVSTGCLLGMTEGSELCCSERFQRYKL